MTERVDRIWEEEDLKRRMGGVVSSQLAETLTQVYEDIIEFTPKEIPVHVLVAETMSAFEKYWLNNSGIYGHVTTDGFVITGGGVSFLMRNNTLEDANAALLNTRKRKRSPQGYSADLVGLGEDGLTDVRYAAVRTAVRRIRDARYEKMRGEK